MATSVIPAQRQIYYGTGGNRRAKSANTWSQSGSITIPAGCFYIIYAIAMYYVNKPTGIAITTNASSPDDWNNGARNTTNPYSTMVAGYAENDTTFYVYDRHDYNGGTNGSLFAYAYVHVQRLNWQSISYAENGMAVSKIDDSPTAIHSHKFSKYAFLHKSGKVVMFALRNFGSSGFSSLTIPQGFRPLKTEETDYVNFVCGTYDGGGHNIGICHIWINTSTGAMWVDNANTNITGVITWITEE